MRTKGKHGIAFCDGSTKGYVGMVIRAPGKQEVSHVVPIDIITNNEAEYLALIKLLLKLDPKRRWKVYTDSMLVVKQINGDWGLKAENLKSYHDEAIYYIESLKLDISLAWVGRDNNPAGILLEDIKRADNKSEKQARTHRSRNLGQ